MLIDNQMGPDNLVVVGASVAGFTAAQTLRLEGYRGNLTIIGAEVRRPYERPPLSKQVLRGDWDPETASLPGDVDANWLLGISATELDIGCRKLRLSDGSLLAYGGLVIATGLTPRRLPFGGELSGIHVLRSLEDSLALRQDLLTSARLVVIGAGFLGAEVAATARKMGLDVALVDALEFPMVRQCGEIVGRRVLQLHEEHGVQVITGTGVTAFGSANGRVTEVVLTDGRTIAADTVLVAIGSDPAIGWLSGSGLSLSNGIDCDSSCRAAPGIVAAGDVANWVFPGLNTRVRVEHRMNAAEHGIAAAKALLGSDEPFAPVPYAWTDQYDARIQIAGTVTPDAVFRVAVGSLDDRFVGEYVANGCVTAVLGWNAARDFTQRRRGIGQTAGADLL
ncbi:NAD(P)/FAD-dependent oxidoreductase [Rhodococcus wratislaviensis]|nr:FAD-dependent oxidoreductase [Rhodococcus wratislaviensis]